jgi:hypothetical protein
LGEQLGLKPAEVYRNVADNIGRLVSQMMQGSEFKVLGYSRRYSGRQRPGSWLVGLWPRGEITPGLVALDVDPGREVLLLTKAGGYGAPDYWREYEVR